MVVVFVAIFWREDYRGGRNAVTHDCRSDTIILVRLELPFSTLNGWELGGKPLLDCARHLVGGQSLSRCGHRQEYDQRGEKRGEDLPVIHENRLARQVGSVNAMLPKTERASGM